MPTPLPLPTSDTPIEKTAATEFDGDYRIAEPGERRQRRDNETQIEAWIMPLGEHRHPRIGSSSGKSASVGTVTAGYIAQAVELPIQGEHHRILDKVAPRQTRYTTKEMAELLLCAAERVAKEHPGRVLQLGNMSRQSGGPLPWSVSHHNGRDADVAFYALDSENRPATMARLYHFDSRGRSTNAPEVLTFDVAANWSLLKSLVLCSGDDLQYLFIANWLSFPALRYAQKIKEDKKVIAKVAAKVHQPKKAMPHNDHVHVRIGCPDADRAEGCVEASRAPKWAWGQPAGVRARFAAMRTALQSSVPQERADALYLLGLYRDGASYSEVENALRDPSGVVRTEAIRAIADWDRAGAADVLIDALRRETEAACGAQILLSLASMQAREALVTLMQDRRALVPSGSDVSVPVVQVRKTAAILLTDAPTLPAARAAVTLLDDADLSVRDAARRLLERATNYVTPDLLAEFGPQLASVQADQPLDAAGERALWAKLLDSQPHDATLADIARQGFVRHGIDLEGESRRLPALVQALGMPAPWRDNAVRHIEQLLHYRPSVGKGAHANPQAFWPQFLIQRKHLSSDEVNARLAASLYTHKSAESAGDKAEAALSGISSSVPAAEID